MARWSHSIAMVQLKALRRGRGAQASKVSDGMDLIICEPLHLFTCWMQEPFGVGILLQPAKVAVRRSSLTVNRLDCFSAPQRMILVMTARPAMRPSVSVPVATPALDSLLASR